ncbi:UNVERIFIED_CONTAM: hypothetical protein GTU68_062086, partial [Idotea baltica]|nr:hypothetical protein [Idotea baltica]
PNPTTELIYSSTFELLIAVLLSAQATDISVNKATAILFTVANTAQTMNQLSYEKLCSYIKTIGLYPTKAKHILQTCQILIKEYNGNVPSTREALESLPGVGRKTANVVLNTAYKQPVIAVDTHIFRVSNRTKIAPGVSVIAVEKKLMTVIPKPFLLNAHHWIILHGRYVCQAKKPRCGSCMIEDLCEYGDKTDI